MFTSVIMTDIYNVDIRRDEDDDDEASDPALFRVRLEGKSGDLVFNADTLDLKMIRAAIDEVIDEEGKLR